MRERLKRTLRSHPVVPIAATLVLLVLAALVIPEVLSPGNSGETARVLVPDAPLLASFLLVALAVSLVILNIVARAQRPKRPPTALGPRKKSGWLRIVGLLALPILWVVSQPFRDAIQRMIEGAPGSAGDSARRAAEGSGRVAGGTESSQALGAALTLFLLVLVVGTIFLIWTTAKRQQVSPAGGPRSELVSALSLGLEDLRHIASPRAAVIACYSRLQMLAGSMEAHRDTDTPAELMERLVEGYDVNTFDLSVLTSLFERAKFSTHEIDEGMRGEALRALTDVRAQLEAR
jgi:hypothetical protein